MGFQRRWRQWWPVAGVLWPVALVAAMLLWPGEATENLNAYFTRMLYKPTAPPIGAPVEETPTTSMSVSGESGSRVFWQELGSGEVQAHIEIPPAAEAAP
jgi:uncharacterized phage protein gp47/JayE